MFLVYLKLAWIWWSFSFHWAPLDRSTELSCLVYVEGPYSNIRSRFWKLTSCPATHWNSSLTSFFPFHPYTLHTRHTSSSSINQPSLHPKPVQDVDTIPYHLRRLTHSNRAWLKKKKDKKRGVRKRKKALISYVSLYSTSDSSSFSLHKKNTYRRWEIHPIPFHSISSHTLPPPFPPSLNKPLNNQPPPSTLANPPSPSNLKPQHLHPQPFHLCNQSILSLPLPLQNLPLSSLVASFPVGSAACIPYRKKEDLLRTRVQGFKKR